mmetsp:Transcript_27240/g.51610  ORF Transcript_27240/g.51610 Transcript_27240/m.51610 type:complete len:89 (+) Transcript_27240:3-269(+)
MIVQPSFLVESFTAAPLALLSTSTPLSLLSTSNVQSLTTASTAASVVDFTDPGKDLFLAYVVFSLLAGVKALADGWRPTVTSGKNKKK